MALMEKVEVTERAAAAIIAATWPGIRLRSKASLN
jgi:hypothetical protein